MRAERFGSYSTCRTVPATPNLLRLKSMMRYFRLWPPPRRRIEMWPWLSRPPDFFSGSVSDRSGVDRVISLKSDTERKRELLVTGLNCRMPIGRLALEDLDAPLAEGHDRLFPVRPAAAGLPHAPHLAALVGRPHARHLDAEQLLDRLLHGQLVRLRVDLEVVLAALLVGHRALLGDDRAHDGAVQRRHRLLLPLLLGGALLGRRLLRGPAARRALGRRRRLRGLPRLRRRLRGR